MGAVACPLPQRLAAPAPLSLEHALFSGQTFRWQRHGEWYSGFVAGEHVRLKLVEGAFRGVEGAAAPETSGNAKKFRGVEGAAAPETSGIPKEFHGVASGPLRGDDLARYFRADVDLREVERALAFDEPVRRAFARFPGLRILRQDPWETLVSFVLSSVSNIPKITRTVEALASLAGEPKPLGGVTRHAFPTPQALARLSNPELRATGMGFRANYLQGVAKAVARGDLDLERIRTESYEAAVEVLTEVPGVGRKVADCVLLFAYEFPQAFPIDVWVRRGLRRLYVKRKVGDEQLRQWAVRRWNGWAGYAQQYLFHAERHAEDGGARTRPGNRAVTRRARVR